MTDLVQRLRVWAGGSALSKSVTLNEAADRIEQLEHENAELKTLLQTSMEQHELAGRLHQGVVAENAGLRRDATPPAQTPPRLTDEQIEDVTSEWWREDLSMKYSDLARAVEAAVRKQFLGRD